MIQTRLDWGQVSVNNLIPVKTVEYTDPASITQLDVDGNNTIILHVTSDLTITLPTPSKGAGKYLTILNAGDSTAKVIVDGNKIGIGNSQRLEFDGTNWAIGGSPGTGSYDTTTLSFKYELASVWTDADSSSIDKCATVVELDDEIRISQGVVIKEAHGYTIGDYYYLIDDGTISNTRPINKIVQSLFYVIDVDTLLIDISKPVYDDNSFVVTEIKAIYHNGTTWAEAQADSASTLAEMILLGATTAFGKIKQGKARFATAHSYGTGGETLYLSADTAGAITNVEPTSSQIQIVGYVEDDKTVVIDIDSEGKYYNYEFVNCQDAITSRISLTTTHSLVGSITIPSSGIYDILARPFITLNDGSVGIEILKNDAVLFTSNTGTYGVAYDSGSYGEHKYIVFDQFNVSLNAGDVLKLRLWETNSAVAYSGDENPLMFSAKKVAGYLPTVDPLAAEYGRFEPTSTLVPAAGTDLSLASVSGNMNVSSGKIQLKAGVTYKLTASCDLRASYFLYSWRNSAGTRISNQGVSASANSADTSTAVIAVAMYTPTVDELVSLRADGGGSSQAIWSKEAFAITAEAIAGQLPVSTINDQSSSSYMDIGNMRMAWGSSSIGNPSGTVTFPAPFSTTPNITFSDGLDNSSSRYYNILTKSSTGFTARCFYEDNNQTTGTVSWIAIGLKP